MNLLILDTEYSRSLTYRMQRLKKDINKLPNTIRQSEKTVCQENIDAVISKIESLDLENMLQVDKNQTCEKT